MLSLTFLFSIEYFHSVQFFRVNLLSIFQHVLILFLLSDMKYLKWFWFISYTSLSHSYLNILNLDHIRETINLHQDNSPTSESLVLYGLLTLLSQMLINGKKILDIDSETVWKLFHSKSTLQVESNSMKLQSTRDKDFTKASVVNLLIDHLRYEKTYKKTMPVQIRNMFIQYTCKCSIVNIHYDVINTCRRNWHYSCWLINHQFGIETFDNWCRILGNFRFW